MNKRIFRSIVSVGFAVLIATLALTMSVLYDYFSGIYADQLHSETMYVAGSMDYMDRESYDDYFAKIEKTVPDGIRITWIDADGSVLYDSSADVAQMENHGDREEVKEAMENGSGFSSRYSSTMAKKTVYYAALLQDGSVIRLSGTYYSPLSLIYSIVQPLLVIAVVVLVLSALLAGRVSKRLTKPFEELDLEHPEQMDTYEELTPLLRRIAGQNHQISEQMEQLTSQRNQLSTICENMQEGLLVLNNNSEVLLYNSSALRLLGLEDLPDRASALTVNRSKHFRISVQKALAGEHSEEMMHFGERCYQIIANPVYDKDSVVGAVLVILDVTEEQEREQLRREFTANVSHELKTPLTSISGFAEIMKNGIAQAEDIPHFADNIYKEAQRLLGLVEDIIKLSQLDESDTVMVRGRCDLTAVVSGCICQLEDEAKKHDIKIEQETESCFVTGIESILEELVHNLVENAIKYNLPGGKVFVSLHNTPKGPLLQVKDTGVGIPKDEQQRVFERFYRVDKSHSATVSGTGLGLSIVKHAAAFHGAEVFLESEPGQGSTFSVQFLPCEE